MNAIHLIKKLHTYLLPADAFEKKVIVSDAYEDATIKMYAFAQSVFGVTY